jgi:heat shock protein HslJ
MKHALVAILPLALSACAAASAGGNSALTDSIWRFSTIDGATPVSDKATLEFHSDRLGANVGCNGMGGPWRIEGARLIAGPMISTQMWCDKVMDQERAVSALLSGGPELTVNGNSMTLKSNGHSAELVRAAPATD